MDHRKKDFFISYTGTDQHWAEWIAWQLEDAGYTTILQAWDFHPGSNFVQDMQKALVNSQRMITVLSPRYLASAYAQAEWSAVFAKDPTGENGLLIPIRIEKCELQGLHKAIIYIDLVRKDHDEAKSFLLKQIEQVINRERKKKYEEPPYPGNYRPEPRFPGALPKVWNLPRPNPNFTGREQILRNLRASLIEAKSTALTQQALHGLGGIGKSQLAIEYAYRYNTSYDYVWWIRAEEETSLVTDITNLAKDVNLPEKDAEEQYVIIQAMLRWLNIHNGWLLIFDNAKNVISIRNYLPNASSGHVLVTSRYPDWTTIGKSINIDVWQRDESINFITKRTGNDDKTAADKIAEVLGDLPLALEQAGAYIKTKKKSFTEYLHDFQSRRKELWKREKKLWDEQKKQSEYPDTVATTWAMAFEAIKEIVLAKDLLLLCSIAAPDVIPKSLIKRALEYVEGSDSNPVAIDSFDLDDAIAALCSYSLITSNTATFSIHRLVQTVAMDLVENEEAARNQSIMLKALSQEFPNEGYESPSCWFECEQLLPHAEKLTDEATFDGMKLEETATLMNKMGLYFHGRALYAKSESFFLRASEIFEKQQGPQNPAFATSLNNIAHLLLTQGKYSEAEPLFRRSLEIREKQLDPNHPEVAQGLNNLAALYQYQGKYAKAEPLYQRALQINKQVLGPDHYLVATNHNNLANLLLDQGKYSEAELLYRRALQIFEQALGPDHPAFANNLSDLASLLDIQGKYTEAEPLARRALQIKEQALGLDHPEVATSLSNLAALLRDQGKYGDAEPLYRRALDIREKQLGPKHLDVGVTLNNLGLLHEDQGNYAEAEPLYRRALQIKEQALGPDHPAVATTLNNFAHLFYNQRKYTEAEPLYWRSLEIREKQLGPDHPAVAASLKNLALLHGAQGKFAEAVSMCQRAVQIYENAYGKSHPYTIKAENHLTSLQENIENK